MKIGFVGLGKLGLPCATCVDMKGHDVMGYDLDSSRMTTKRQPYQEAGPGGKGDFNSWLASSTLKFGSLEEVVEHGEDLIFVAVQTPHDPKYEGVTPLPDERKDFSYKYLQSAVGTIDRVCRDKGIKRTVVIISTCLPGTVDNLKEAWRYIDIVYNPFFIAMGTTMRDFLNPEFVLVGVEKEAPARKVGQFYNTMVDAKMWFMSIMSAELTKVAYNTYISSKIAFANTVMEICDNQKMDKADCDAVINALSDASTRLISPAYLRGGMGDGGGCHPRDNIAMSWLAKRLGLSHDLFEDMMKCRQDQSKYLVKLVVRFKEKYPDLPVAILGYAFKPETNLTVGSPALLLKHQLEDRGMKPFVFDHVVEDKTPLWLNSPAIVVIGCKHELYKDYPFPKGSVVIDPHRYIPDREGVVVHRIGEGR